MHVTKVSLQCQHLANNSNVVLLKSMAHIHEENILHFNLDHPQNLFLVFTIMYTSQKCIQLICWSHLCGLILFLQFIRSKEVTSLSHFVSLLVSRFTAQVVNEFSWNQTDCCKILCSRVLLPSWVFSLNTHINGRVLANWATLFCDLSFSTNELLCRHCGCKPTTHCNKSRDPEKQSLNDNGNTTIRQTPV